MGDVLLAAVALALLVAVLWLAARSRLRELPGRALAYYRTIRDADRRAEALLRDVLGPDEYASLAGLGYLEVPSPHHPGRAYRIPRHGGIVVVYEGGRVSHGLCVHAVESIPAADAVAMHKLMIEGAEDEYLERANRVSLIAFSRYGIDVLGGS